MSVSAIIARINKDAEKEAAQIREETDREVDQILHIARLDAEQAYNTILSAGEREIKQELTRSRSSLQIDIRRSIRESKELIIKHSFDQVTLELSHLRDEKKYPVILKGLIIDGIKTLDKEEVTIFIDSRDHAVAWNIIDGFIQKSIIITISDTFISTIGGVIIKSGDVSIDNTLEARMERMQRDLLIQVASILSL